MNESGLNFLIDQAEKKRNSAGVNLADARQKASEIKDQLKMLEQYRNEYTNRLNNALSKGSTLPVVRDYQAFIKKIDQSIAEAKQVLVNQQSEVTKSQDHLQSEQKTLSSYTTLADRQKQVKDKQEQKKEMRLLDEISNDRWLRNKTDDNKGF